MPQFSWYVTLIKICMTFHPLSRFVAWNRQLHESTSSPLRFLTTWCLQIFHHHQDIVILFSWVAHDQSFYAKALWDSLIHTSIRCSSTLSGSLLAKKWGSLVMGLSLKILIPHNEQNASDMIPSLSHLISISLISRTHEWWRGHWVRSFQKYWNPPKMTNVEIYIGFGSKVCWHNAVCDAVDAVIAHGEIHMEDVTVHGIFLRKFYGGGINSH